MYYIEGPGYAGDNLPKRTDYRDATELDDPSTGATAMLLFLSGESDMRSHLLLAALAAIVLSTPVTAGYAAHQTAGSFNAGNKNHGGDSGEKPLGFKYSASDDWSNPFPIFPFEGVHMAKPRPQADTAHAMTDPRTGYVDKGSPWISPSLGYTGSVARMHSGKINPRTGYDW